MVTKQDNMVRNLSDSGRNRVASNVKEAQRAVGGSKGGYAAAEQNLGQRVVDCAAVDDGDAGLAARVDDFRHSTGDTVGARDVLVVAVAGGEGIERGGEGDARDHAEVHIGIVEYGADRGFVAGLG